MIENENALLELVKQFQGQALIHNRRYDLDKHLLTPCK